MPAQAHPKRAGRAGGSTDQNLRPGLGPLSDGVSPVHNILYRIVLWAPVFRSCSCWSKEVPYILRTLVAWINTIFNLPKKEANVIVLSHTVQARIALARA